MHLFRHKGFIRNIILFCLFVINTCMWLLLITFHIFLGVMTSCTGCIDFVQKLNLDYEWQVQKGEEETFGAYWRHYPFIRYNSFRCRYCLVFSKKFRQFANAKIPTFANTAYIKFRHYYYYYCYCYYYLVSTDCLSSLSRVCLERM
jgi:hypothetical protein